MCRGVTMVWSGNIKREKSRWTWTREAVDHKGCVNPFLSMFNYWPRKEVKNVWDNKYSCCSTQCMFSRWLSFFFPMRMYCTRARNRSKPVLQPWPTCVWLTLESVGTYPDKRFLCGAMSQQAKVFHQPPSKVCVMILTCVLMSPCELSPPAHACQLQH